MATRTLPALAVAIALALWGSLSFYQAVTTANSANGDPFKMALQLPRYAPVEQVVPPGTVLGYITDSATAELRGATILSAAQYALAPRWLREGTAQERVLGNFTQPADFAALGAAQGLDVEKDFGNGLILYRRKRP